LRRSTSALPSFSAICGELMEQAAGSSGSATEELLSERIASQEAELQRLAGSANG
jgi:hypothetical protein